MTIPPRAVTAFIGPSGCGKSTVLRTLNRMHEVIPGGRVEGKVLLDGQDLYAGTSTRWPSAAPWAWCSSARTRSPR
jgi:phosphate transport system ATP-binding protein